MNIGHSICLGSGCNPSAKGWSINEEPHRGSTEEACGRFHVPT
jgi:hypothetical protein